jgi:pteridine reductase
MTTIDLKGKIALVTGSARRLGKAIALDLARHGMNLVVHHNRSPQDAEATAAEIRVLGVNAVVVQADQSRPADVTRMFDEIRQHYGRIDLLVNSAANFESGSILDITYEDWQRSLSVNLDGPFLCSQHAAKLMRSTGIGGVIINIADITAVRPAKGFPAHSVSKAGLLSLTEVLAKSLAPDIRVNAIIPGSILRDEGNSPEQWQAIGECLPLGHTGDPSDISQAVIFLATQTFITGATLRIDGGDYLR